MDNFTFSFLPVSLLYLSPDWLFWLKFLALCWIRMVKWTPLSYSWFLRKCFKFFPIQYDIGYGLSYVAFIVLMYDPSMPSFLSALSWNDFQFYFSTSIEMSMLFLSLILFMCYITFTDLCMLNRPCISGMKKKREDPNK